MAIWALLLEPCVPAHRDEALVWKLDKYSAFSAKSALEAVHQKRRMVDKDLCLQIWDGIVPKRMKFF